MKTTDETTVSHTAILTNGELQTAIVRTYQLLQEAETAHATACLTAKPDFPPLIDEKHITTMPAHPDPLSVRAALHRHLVDLIEVQRARAAAVEPPAMRFLARLFGGTTKG